MNGWNLSRSARAVLPSAPSLRANALPPPFKNPLPPCFGNKPPKAFGAGN
jgi:hypothetical protein